MNAVRINSHLAIPLSQIQLDFTTSQGPGGQNVNKVATRAVLTFDVARSSALSDDQRARINHAIGSRISREGILRIVCGKSRSQDANRKEALAIFARLLAGALRPRRTRRPTKPSAASVQRRLTQKSVRSERKRHRRSAGWDDS